MHRAARTNDDMGLSHPITVSFESLLTMVAIIIGPLAALLIQKYLEDRRAKTDRKVKIFRELMANRATRLAPNYVQALNGIETEFYGQSNVIEAWRGLIDHLNTPQPADAMANQRWVDHVTDLLNDLLYEMGESLRYHFDRVTLKRSVYHPAAWNTTEEENRKLRQAAVKVFEGEKALKVEVANDAPIPVAPNPLPRVG